MSIRADFTTGRFLRHLSLKSLAICGGASSALQLLNVFWPNPPVNLLGLWPFLIVILASLVAGVVVSWPRPIEMECDLPKVRIRLIKGDLLTETGHIAVGICDTFDTSTPKIISRKSLLGQTIDRIFGGDVSRLDKLLAVDLKRASPVAIIEKEGKTKRYEVGTVAVVPHDPRLIFFMAYCEMNSRNQAQGSIEGVWKTLTNLWTEVSARGNHGSISVPVIGGGPARMSNLLPAQDAIRLIALSFMFASRKSKVSDELRIVVQESEYKRLDRMELQSFLSSLRPS